ncbi:hypothetical protein OS187_07040 [Xanthomonadaceae bacterium JHOS43]|nr:hypothetical protein [Xanthomonadaceae bacterium JHOS43]MCX7562926.1 hypothetical protein [Xanthomonadaceae bacterium XH05]
MNLDASIPKALYQANIDLALRIAALLQENGKQWFDLFAEEASTRLEEGLSQAGSLGRGLSLEKLASLPADAATQFLQIDLGRWQALLSSAVQNQSHFADGLQEALGQWQAACTEAFDTVTSGDVLDPSAALAALPGFPDMTASLRRFMTQMVPAMDALVVPRKPAPAPAAKKAAAEKPAVEEPAEKKSAVKKPASSKAATPTAGTPAQPARRKAAKKAPDARAPALTPKPLPAVVTASRKSRKPKV